jgi:small subunit ribosomal protein S8
MTQDLISDMLTRIRNASCSNKAFATVLYSKIVFSILEVLKAEGYINDWEIKSLINNKREIKIILKYQGWWVKRPYFRILKRISKPGQRIYLGYREFQKKFPNLRYSHGVAILSTSSGIMTHKKAFSLRKGGEILCYIE